LEIVAGASHPIPWGAAPNPEVFLEQGLYLWYDIQAVQAEEPMTVNGDYTHKALRETGALFLLKAA